MYVYLAKRLSLMVLTLVVITLASYIIIRAAPGDPTRSDVLGDTLRTQTDGGGSRSPISAQLRQDFYLDRNPFVGYSLWLRDVVWHGDLKRSIIVDPGTPTLTVVTQRALPTLKLSSLAVGLIYLLAIPLGIYCAVAHRSWGERTVTLVLFMLYSLPSFWVALLLLAFFSGDTFVNWFPAGGLAPDDEYGWGRSNWQILLETSRHYVLPVICLTYASLAGLSRYARAGMIEVIGQDFIRTARAKGLSEWHVIMKHALRNSLIPLVTIFAELLPGLIAGSIIVEYLFNIPGMGSLSLLALSSRDYPLMMVLFAAGAILTLLGILISDLLYVVVDPRISLE